MPDPTTTAAVDTLVTRLAAAWNAGDGTAFAAEFTPDADFVNVRAEHASGRQAIAAGHDAIFRGIYAGSVVRYEVRQLRELAPGVLLAHLDARLHVPAGPLAGDLAALPSLVLVRGDGDLRIAAFHNTPHPKR